MRLQRGKSERRRESLPIEKLIGRSPFEKPAASSPLGGVQDIAKTFVDVHRGDHPLASCR